MISRNFDINELQAGDVITLKGLHGEWARWLIAEVGHSILRCIILYDISNSTWTGSLMSFAKSEIDGSKWEKIIFNKEEVLNGA